MPRHLPALAALAASLLLAACGKPMPPEHAAYVGTWRAPQMALRITADSRVEYERHDGGVSTSVSGPIQEFVGDDFKVGFGPVSTTFVVSRPPHVEGDKTWMTVDGVELQKEP